MKRSHRTSDSGEHGAVAVEFALVAPILIALIVAIVEFSNAYNIQVSVTQASREAARTMAITHDAAKAIAAGKAGAPSINTSLLSFDLSSATCPAATPPATASVTATYSGTSLTGFFGSSLVLKGKGAMQCGG
ncbi:pilus assembly protein [Arthrobacter sp. DNA4]|uniref:TadE/TadG family type IV pilus assembly protein n=1 Tax=Arthrobacter sp. DNA4 TaxID=2963432 RepID=UPI0020CBB7A7|nr:TadE family protein [Arthrobacter sp. DNA4]UTT68503.1 pilus assembly protein [Arthrobacter sp. DNA4]